MAASATRSSVRKRKQSVAADLRASKSAKASHAPSTSSTLVRSLKLKPVLRSAYIPIKPVIKNVRDPPMIEYDFTSITAQASETGKVVFTDIPGTKTIQIAADWPTGEEKFKNKIPHFDTGFINKGFTKRGIYVSIQYIILLRISI